ncbi:MAG: pyruvate kinase [Leptospiraceae bacterium]|nr:pyruvate kinase [Leptospiraceae bacterium]MDW7975766.1 pyruvate kinase [Leptospiraceae bacterium]
MKHIETITDISLQRRDFRHTKIICTIGPSTSKPSVIEQLAKAGMNIARINMSHGTQETHLQVIKTIKGLNRKLNHPIAILIDLQGPEIRTGDVSNRIQLHPGEIFTFTIIPNVNVEEKSVFVNYKDIIKDLKEGDRITVDNGLINLQVLEKDLHLGTLKCLVLEGGELGSRKHINLPGVRVNLPSITDKDKEDILFAVQQDVDFIALSFVRRAEDVRQAREIIEKADGHAQIIAKIENQEGLDHFDEILEEADGIMVARGDLGVEIEIQDLPIVQREIVQKCIKKGKPVIVATHMLESMIQNPFPTRAEVTDVANAIYEQVDAIMLSGETAVGKYPVKAVEMLDRIARRMEKEKNIGFHLEREPTSIRESLAKAACILADNINAPAIVVITRRGLFARQVASFRPKKAIIYAFTNMSSTRRKLWLIRSVVPFVLEFSQDPEKTIRKAFEKLRERNRVLPGDPIVVLSDVEAGHEKVTTVQVRVFQ